MGFEHLLVSLAKVTRLTVALPKVNPGIRFEEEENKCIGQCVEEVDQCVAYESKTNIHLIPCSRNEVNNP